MKPVSPTFRVTRSSDATRLPAGRNHHQPLTDWSFQAATPNLRGGAMPHHPGTRRPSFHQLSQEFFSAEAGHESRLEGWAFGAIVLMAAWPIALAAQAMLTLIK